jgi:hypothetical protein
MRRRPLWCSILACALLSPLLAGVPARAQVTGLTLGVDRPSPQQLGTTVTFTAAASGGAGPYEYRYWISRAGAAYEAVSPSYGASETLLWTPAAADSYRVMVYARTQGSTVAFEKSAVRSGYYIVAEAPVSAVTVSASKASPQQVGTALSFSATATGGGPGGVEYQFWLAQGAGAYRLVQDYAVASASWSPVPGDMDAADSYLVKVNARSVGSIAPFEKTATKEFVLIADAPVKSVTLSADKASPQDVATVGTVTFTAVAVPGVPRAAVEYQFWLYTTTSGRYVPVGDVTTGFSLLGTWHWTPTVADNYKVMVYARTVGGTAAYEKLKVLFYTVYTSPPLLGEVTPAVAASPADLPRTFSAVYIDPNGFEELKIADILVNDTASEANGIFARYDRTLGKLYLANDAATAYVGNCLPGSAVTLSNSQGSLNCVATSVRGAGTDLTIAWSLTPKAAFAAETAKNVYTHAKDTANVQVGWDDRGDWTISGALDLANCAGCHGNPPDAGLDGTPGTADDAPNVMGDGTSAAGTGSTPKPYDDGYWGFNVNGHGANGTAANTPKQILDPGPPAITGPYLKPNAACADCHDLAQPAAGSARHLNGILNSVERKCNPSENTAHLRSDGSYPYVVAGGNQWDVQIGFDRACWLRCHQSKGLSNMRHARDLTLSPTNLNVTPNAVRLGDKVTRQDGLNILYPIDVALTTNASTAPDHFVPCISCHNPHGTATLEPHKSTNRMVRDQYHEQSTLCRVCHV